MLTTKTKDWASQFFKDVSDFEIEQNLEIVLVKKDPITEFIILMATEMQ